MNSVLVLLCVPGCEEFVGAQGKNSGEEHAVKKEGEPWRGGSIGWSVDLSTKKVVGSIPGFGTWMFLSLPPPTLHTSSL